MSTDVCKACGALFIGDFHQCNGKPDRFAVAVRRFREGGVRRVTGPVIPADEEFASDPVAYLLRQVTCP